VINKTSSNVTNKTSVQNTHLIIKLGDIQIVYLGIKFSKFISIPTCDFNIFSIKRLA